jgi:hypothetical protein
LRDNNCRHRAKRIWHYELASNDLGRIGWHVGPTGATWYRSCDACSCFRVGLATFIQYARGQESLHHHRTLGDRASNWFDLNGQFDWSAFAIVAEGGGQKTCSDQLLLGWCERIGKACNRLAANNCRLVFNGILLYGRERYTNLLGAIRIVLRGTIVLVQPHAANSDTAQHCGTNQRRHQARAGQFVPKHWRAITHF